MSLALAPVLLAFLAFEFFAFRRTLTYLHIFQQEEYDGPRFLAWIGGRRAFDRRATLVLVFLAGISMLSPFLRVTGLVAATVLFGAGALLAADPRVSGKKRLVLTARATRIAVVSMVLTSCVGIAATLAAAGDRSLSWILWIAGVQFVPFSLALGNALLSPFEARTQKRYWLEAKTKLDSLKPTIIGITGSYGKTSVKHILAHVLDANAPTLMTPGSVNTPMGISRIVRERLDATHRFFVCEMGAYGPGSISRLTALAQPNLAVVTAVGMAHYERFKTLEAVAKTKMELPDAAIAQGGRAILAEGILQFEAPRVFLERYPDRVVLVGTGEKCHLRILAARLTRNGSEVDIAWHGAPFTLRSPLFGEHQALNLCLAFAAACELGVAPADAAILLGSVPQIKHRLEIKPQPGGWIAIDDAYNSNPVGFASGLRALDLLRGEGGRRILATPGMVELGTAHDEEHAKIGTLAASLVDVLLPVMPERIATLVESYQKGNPKGLVVPCQSHAEAQAWLNANLRANDSVLIENDLPDLYERKLSL